MTHHRWHRPFLLFTLLSTVLLAACASEGREAAARRVKVTTPATQPLADILAAPAPFSICSFNIQFLGMSTRRDHQALANLVAQYDIVVVQELVAPPYPGTFPDATPFNPDPQAAAFFDAMKAHGFSYVLSEEDTGTGNTIHINSSATEWWVTFFKPTRVQLANDLPGGFLAADRSNHPDYERVPYGVGFRRKGGGTDFVLISVHLEPDANAAGAARRKHELQTIAGWIASHSQTEHDFIILGDMNIQSATELASATPPSFISLNDECRPTNTNVNGPRPYDHVMYNPQFTQEINTTFDFQVIDLAAAMKPLWTLPTPYPGDPYVHDDFRAIYSDHNPVVFRMNLSPQDDD